MSLYISQAEQSVMKLMQAGITYLLEKLHIKIKPGMIPYLTRGIVVVIVGGSVILKDLITGAYRSDSGDKTIRWIENHAIIAAIAITAFMVMVGAFTAAWKKLHLGSYAVIEILFGVSVAFNVALDLAAHPSKSKLFVIVTTTYLIARGFNNALDASHHSARFSRAAS